MRKVLLALLVALAAVSVGGAAVAKSRLIGTFRDGTYTSPDASFRVKVPAVLDASVVVSDVVGTDGEGVVTFSDDWCRQFYVHRIPLPSPLKTQDQLLGFVRLGIATAWETSKRAVIDSIEPIDVGRGLSAAMRLHQPGGPCRALVVEGGKPVDKEVPSDVVAYVFVESDTVYEIGLTVGRRKVGEMKFAPSATEEDLKAFLAGLVTQPHEISR